MPLMVLISPWHVEVVGKRLAGKKWKHTPTGNFWVSRDSVSEGTGWGFPGISQCWDFFPVLALSI